MFENDLEHGIIIEMRQANCSYLEYRWVTREKQQKSHAIRFAMLLGEYDEALRKFGIGKETERIRSRAKDEFPDFEELADTSDEIYLGGYPKTEEQQKRIDEMRQLIRGIKRPFGRGPSK